MSKVKNSIGFCYCLFFISWFFLSCNYTKHLQKNEILLNKNSLQLSLKKKIKYKGEFESSILSLASPTANTHIFDLDFLPKYKLWKYNNRYNYYEKHDTDKKVIRHKVEKPALLDTATIKRSEKQMKQFMINQGYYFSEVSSEINYHNQEADVLYKIITGKSYYIKNIIYKTDNKIIEAELPFIKEKTIFKKGEIFTNNNCGIERDRIYKYMRNKGYYDFKNDNTSFIADTTNKDKLKQLLDDPFAVSANYVIDTSNNDSLDVIINIEQSKDSTYYIKYVIDSVVVSIGNLKQNETIIETELDQIYFKYNELPINRKVIAQNIFVRANEFFSTENKEATISRLNQLNIFKNVSISYEKSKSKIGALVCNIHIEMMDKYSFQISNDVSTSDGYYSLGLGSVFTYNDKNLFHGGNQLLTKVSGSFQWSTIKENNENKLFRSGVNLNVTNSLIFPKFIVPFNQNKFNKKNVPFTVVSLNINYNDRFDNNNTKQFQIFNLSGSFGYSWKENAQKTWSFIPTFLTLNLVPPKSLSNYFIQKKDSSQYFNSIFSSSVILGENINYQFKSKPKGLYGSFHTLKIGVEEAGTILNGINALYKNITNDSINNISHYARFDVDFRKYFIRRKTQWANRIMIGYGIPIGKQNIALPYIKQYSVGGPSSIRGWQARTLGPGHYSDTSQLANNKILDITGDIKFEANTEYRFNLLKLFSGAINLKGATFIDVGNVWLTNKKSANLNELQNGVFQPNYFLNDIAVATGFGLRLDFSFFIFRIDVGYKVKEPSLASNYGFRINQLKLKEGNFGVGFSYPF